jgi:hypothetical protein
MKQPRFHHNLAVFAIINRGQHKMGIKITQRQQLEPKSEQQQTGESRIKP